MTREQRAHVLIAPLKIWAALMALLAATFLYAFLPDAPLKLAVSLVIAAAKALLIAILFMQLKQATGLVRMAALAGTVWVSFLYLIAFADYLTR
jgi:cytochrome c oxidase subunit 4